MRSDFYVFLMKLQLGTNSRKQPQLRAVVVAVVVDVVVAVVSVALGIFTSGNQNICS